MQSGQPDNISFGIDGLGNLNERFTGSVNVGARPIYTGRLQLYRRPTTPGSSRRCISSRLPAFKGSQGFDSAPRNVYRPGDNIWDISVFKNIPFMKRQEGSFIQLRMEMFNALNQVRFNDFNRSMTFSRDGKTSSTCPTPSAATADGSDSVRSPDPRPAHHPVSG